MAYVFKKGELAKLNRMTPDEFAAAHGLLPVKNQRRMPAQKPATSNQSYATPEPFIAAVKARFGVKALAWDLAAVAATNKAPPGCYYGPDHVGAKHRRDAFANDWTRLRGDLWLNPPFNDIAPWARKCAESAPWRPASRPRRIFFLVPASVGANWWVQWVHNKARVEFLNGRISFDGKGPHPKDCSLAIYGEKPGYGIWRWKDQLK